MSAPIGSLLHNLKTILNKIQKLHFSMHQSEFASSGEYIRASLENNCIGNESEHSPGILGPYRFRFVWWAGGDGVVRDAPFFHP